MPDTAIAASGRCIEGPAMLTVPRFANFELGVVATLPMEHQMTSLPIETRNDLGNVAITTRDSSTGYFQ